MNNRKEQIIKCVERLYNIKITCEYTTGCSYNHMFEIEKEGNQFVLRISEYNDTEKRHIDLELNWMDYLAKKINNIVKPVKNSNNNIYEIINVDDKDYIVCLFEKAKGRHVDVNNPTEFNDRLFFDLGILMGKMHKLTAEYEGSNIENPEFTARSLDIFHTSPKSKDTYGIIHNDVSPKNFFINSGYIYLFDFDDCVYGWYSEDIAIHFYYMLSNAELHDKSEKYAIEFAENYLITYLKGYMQTYHFNKQSLHEFEPVLKDQMRECYSYLTNFYKGSSENPFKNHLIWLKNKIDNNLPYTDIDYRKIINSLP